MNVINLQEVFYVNGIGIILILFLVEMRRKNYSKTTWGERLFDVMLLVTIVTCIAETLSFWLDGKMFFGCIAVSYVLNTVCFAAAGCVGFFWCLYVNYRMFNSLQRIRKMTPFLLIPAVCCLVVCLINLSGNGVLFYIGEDNVYRRGELTIIIYSSLYFYCLYSIFSARKSKRKGLYVEHFPTAFFVVPSIAGTWLQSLNYGIAAGWTGVTIGLLFTYLELQSLNSLVDTLSGLYNRRYLDNLLEHLKRNARHSVYGIMIDADEFKKINDVYGHSVGDDAIRMIGQILADAIPEYAIAIRYAGDEFVILVNTEQENRVRTLMEQIKSDVESFNASGKRPYRLSLSMGYTRFDRNNNSIEEFMSAMDRNMYDAKENYYRNVSS